MPIGTPRASFAYTDFYRTVVTGDLAAQLEAEYKQLSQSLEGARSLPPAVKALFASADGSDLRRYVNLILKDMNPSAPPPLVKFSEVQQRQFESRLNRLLESAEKSLDEAMKAVDDFEPTARDGWNRPDAEAQQIFQKAVLLRYEYTHIFIPPTKPCAR